MSLQATALKHSKHFNPSFIKDCTRLGAVLFLFAEISNCVRLLVDGRFYCNAVHPLLYTFLSRVNITCIYHARVLK